MRRSGSGSVGGNSVLNFITQLFVMVLAFACTPLLIMNLGQEEFGLLSVLWMFIGYFGVLDFGVGQATVKFVAEGLGRGDIGYASSMLRTALLLNLLIGFLSSIVVVVIAFVGIENLLTVNPALHHEANLSLLFLAAGIPFVLLQATLRSVPLAFNRFDLVNGVQAAAGVLQWAGSTLIVLFGGGLVAVVCMTVLTRVVVVVMMVAIAGRYLPESFRRISARPGGTVLTQLLGFGGWVTVSQVVAPLLTLMERLIIGGVLSVAWLTFFVVPNDTVIRLLVIPMSIVNVLFPLVSGVWITDEGRERAKDLYLRSIKYLFLLILPVVLVFVLFGDQILLLWVGKDFAEKSTVVFGVLSVGYLFNALAQVPNATLQALGRPELPARVVLCELPCYAVICFALTSSFGIVGTAVGWMLRVIVEAGVLFLLCGRVMRGVAAERNLAYLWKGVLLLLLGGLLLGAMKVSTADTMIQAGTVASVCALYAIGVWFLVFDHRDRWILRRLRIPRVWPLPD